MRQQAGEERPAVVDLGEAERQHAPLGLLLIGDAPAQIDLAPSDTALLAQFAKLREDVLDQTVAFSLHVPEGRGDKDPDGAARR